VSGLGVIAWTSAPATRASRARAAEIGRELDAGYVLEGSVQWARTPGGGNRVRVTPRLVRVSDARQIWAEPYEAELANVFAIQTAVAERVAAALDVALLAPERRSVAARPTRGVAAYDSYLRGNALTTRGLTYVPQARRDAARHYERAVALDPAFASAWARLALAHWRIHVSRDDPTPARLARARAAAARAFALDSTLPEANLALGEISDGRWGRHRALRRRPPRAPEQHRAALRARRGAAGPRAPRRRARELHARGGARPAVARRAGGDREPARRAGEYGRAVRVRARQIALDSSSTMAYVAQAVSLVNWRGDTAAVRRTLDQAVRAAGRARLLQMLARGSGVRVARVLWPALDRGDAPGARHAVRRGAQSAPWRVYRLKADHFELSGQAARARAYHDSARAGAAAALRAQPRDAELRTELGLAYAGLGRAAEALREGRRALALDSAGADVERVRRTRYAVATIAARVGAKEEALALLAGGLPSSVHGVTAHWFRLDPAWAPLRDDPRLWQLLAAAR
jgi:serine/threonine-protein kinase